MWSTRHLENLARKEERYRQIREELDKQRQQIVDGLYGHQGQNMTARRGDDGGGGGSDHAIAAIADFESCMVMGKRPRERCGATRKNGGGRHAQQSTNATDSCRSSEEASNSRVCVLCRQRVEERCEHCWQHYAVASGVYESSSSGVKRRPSCGHEQDNAADESNSGWQQAYIRDSTTHSAAMARSFSEHCRRLSATLTLSRQQDNNSSACASSSGHHLLNAQSHKSSHGLSSSHSSSCSCNTHHKHHNHNSNNNNNHQQLQHIKHHNPHAARTTSRHVLDTFEHSITVATATTTNLTTHSTTTNGKAHAKNCNFVGSPFASTLRTLQFLMIYTQLQLLRPLSRKLSNIYRCIKTKSGSIMARYATTTTNTIIKCKYNKRQQRPPHKRLMKFRCNSYYNNDNATSNNYDYDNFNKQQHNNNQYNNKNNNNTNSDSKASHKLQSPTPPPPTAPPSMQQEESIMPQLIENSQPQPLQQQQHHHRHQQAEQQTLLQQYLRYFKMPNLSCLYKILIVLSFLSLFLPSTNAQMQTFSQTLQTQLATPLTGTTDNAPKVTLARNETVCKSMDLRNYPSELRQLQNCTVIEGFLIISLMNTHWTHEFNESYPLLTEVTEYIVIYRVYNLLSLAQIFPNLSIIRGNKLIEGYAMIVHSNPHLTELGLTKLSTIVHGGVRIESNTLLCYVHTVDWSRIVPKISEVMLLRNRNKIECGKCPGDTKIEGSSADTGLACKETSGLRRCWNSQSCQKICPEECPQNCIDENTCCNDACIGCSPTNLNACTICRNFSIYNHLCINECPPTYYGYLNRRCITKKQCLSIGTKYENNKSEQVVPFNGTCVALCPAGYNKIDSTCKKCTDNCIKKCRGTIIDSGERAKDFQGCTHIIKSDEERTDDGLIINIKRGGRHLMEDLQEGLSTIQVIETFLKVQGTYGIFSLSFLKNLKTIGGKKLTEDKFAMYVLENNDLETIWGPNQTVEIKNGRVFFHFNPKLCYSEIESLLKHMTDDKQFDNNEVAKDSNGNMGSCNTEFLNVTIIRIAHSTVTVQILNPMKFDDERTFIGYQFLHMEDKYKNATKYSQRICDDTWIVSDPTKDTTHVFLNLQAFTQYAFYVKTWTISSERRNGQSPIQHFRTKSSQPTEVQTLNAFALNSSVIVVTWTPPQNPHGNLTTYRVRAVLDKRSHQDIETRNYCKDPAQIGKEEDAKDALNTETAVTVPPDSAECKCKPKDGAPKSEIDTKETFINDRILFENTLQNFIYVKQTKSENSSRSSDDQNAIDKEEERRRRKRHSEGGPEDSFLVRHMRAAPEDLENPFLDDMGDPILDGFDPNNTNSGPKSILDPMGKYYEMIVENVSIDTNKFEFTQLKHFSWYSLGVEACREPEEGATKKECSEVKLRFVRTKKLDGVDVIQNLRATLDPTNTTRQIVRLYWDPPDEPNGAVVSYTISYIRDTPDAVEEKKCITDSDYRNMTNGYVLSGLPAGNYSIKVRANSLAGDGTYSEPVTVDIPPTQISTMVIVISCVVGVVIVAAIALAVYIVCKKMAPPSDLKIFPTVNPYYISLQYLPDEWEVARDRIIQLKSLGQGSFGMVYEGILKGYNNSSEDTPCAIKTVNENATDRERMNFLNEASVMKQFDTYHVVRLLGVCSIGQPALVVMELMKHGDLKSYLRAHRPDERDDDGTISYLRGEGGVSLQPPTLNRIYQMAIEIADGMAYLAAKKFVHRDLAARNCMVAADLTVKIGDFGMTRDIYETDYYRKGTKGLLPVRWMPPESLRDGVYSTASDVFSYGVVLWEMVTLAAQPYPGYSNDQVLRFVIEGGVMERPENCPEKIYELMQQCWEHRPSKRPSFLKIIRQLLDHSHPKFREVSFYHSAEGEQEREKDRTDDDAFADDNYACDVNTPLRYNEIDQNVLHMGNNSSVENAGDSPLASHDDEQPHSPYSMASAIGVSSTPDGQSKNSFNLSQMSHNNPTLLSSVPSTSAGIISGGSHSHSQSHPQRFPRAPYPHHPDEEGAAYVQPDYDPTSKESGATGRSVESDERGYELYNPSTGYLKDLPYDPADDEEDFDGIGFSGRSGRLSGGQNLLPRQKAAQQAPVIMPMSSSMPDEMTSTLPASSLHPSTASAASSNASSNTTTTHRYPTLAKALAETFVPMRFRNRRFFNHKRSGSNASHKSTSSNPNAASSNSASNLAGGSSSGRDKPTSGHNLGTIESGGSGSAGSYTQRFFNPAAGSTSAALTTENPNYKLLDESANASCISAAGDEGATTSTPKKPITKSYKPSTTAGFATSTNPNYQLLDETLNVTATPKKSSSMGTTTKPISAASPYGGALYTSDNPNYEPMDAPAPPPSESTPNYMVMMMDEPSRQSHASSTSPIAFAHMSENPNYKMMGPQSSEHGSSASSEASWETDDEADNNERMDCIPLSRRRPRERQHRQQPPSHDSLSRSRTQSQNQKDDKVPTTSTTSAAGDYMGLRPGVITATAPTSGGGDDRTLTTQSQSQRPSATYSLKEKWLRQQQTQPPPPPPPNGFIGPEV